MSKVRKASPAQKCGILAAMAVLMAVLMLPVALDAFSHGYFCDESAYGPLPPEDVQGYADLADGGASVWFVPAQKHFRGFLLALANQPEGNAGQLLLTVCEEDGTLADRLTVDLGRVRENQWYRTYLNKELKAGRRYSLTIEAENCRTYPWLQLVGENHTAPETEGMGLLMGYAYGKGTFSGMMKAGIFFLLAFVWCMAAGCLFLPKDKRLALNRAAACLLLGVLLMSNYILCYMDSPEAISAAFDAGSEKLAVNSMETGYSIDGYGLTLEKDGVYLPYKSQFGLQGHVFRVLSRFAGVRALRSLCAAAMAAVVMGIVLIVRRKYNARMAGCFYVTFWLSPWVVNLAANLYWMEFTWFLPMLLGLVCAWKWEHRVCRLLCYGGAFLGVMVKCLCGYEYVSAVMVGMVAFPLADLACALAGREKKRARQLFLSTFFMGLCALAGFAAALLAHAQLKGGGDLGMGLRLIMEQDVLRRTSGGDMNLFEPVYWASFNASVPETLHLYLQFQTQIITGLPGNLFPLLCILPLAVFAVDWHRGRLSIRDISLYVVFALASVSWLVLAKSHSYIHTNLNFVLWYFGFVQICLYVLLDKLVFVFGRGGKGGQV